MQLEHVFTHYDTTGVRNVQRQAWSYGEGDDCRAYDVTFNSEKRLMIKVCRGDFATPERIQGWSTLIERYSDAGVYAPRIVATMDGSICFKEADYLVYAEDYRRFFCVDEFTPTVTPSEYEEDLFKMVGKIAALPPLIYGWNSAFCLYDTFHEEDFADANFECAEEWYRIFQWAAPERLETLSEIWNTYLAIREELEPVYRGLPKSAFQADLVPENILLDKQRRFTGIMNFERSGTETVLNYVLSECIPPITSETDLGGITDRAFLWQQDRMLQRRIGFVNHYYTFSEAERKTFSKLYNMVVPFLWPTFDSFRKAVTKRQRQHYDNIIDWVAYQVKRTDLSL